MVESEIPYGKVTIDKDLLKSLALQLVTGSVIVTNNSKIDIVEWIEKMVPVYERRFGKSEKGNMLFSEWATIYLEFICYYTEDNSVSTQLEEDVLSSIIAYDLREYLKTLPKNIYINTFINLLEKYII